MLYKKLVKISVTIVLVGGITGATVTLLRTTKLTPKPASSPAVKPFEKITRPSLCKISDAVEYKYYTDVSKDVPNDTKWQNNKFGLYIYAEVTDYFDLAENLVNSNGGDWGYVLIPFNVRDTDENKWSKVFTKLYENHLIPIIQLHDINPGRYKKQTTAAAKFLGKFTWPIKSRYISVYNEPNSANFWYGYIDAKEYARILDYTIDTFKNTNPNFFILNGALNVSAATDRNNLDAFEFMRQMNQEIPGIFNKLDGWASHSYPQPNFSGSPWATGRWSIKAYIEELNYLKYSIGITKDLPVFITETGWAHAEGDIYNPNYLSMETIAQNFKTAYESVWLKDDRVRAVTPFTISYPAPNDHFSWIGSKKVPFKQFDVVESIQKVTGKPPSLETGVISQIECP